MADMTTPGGGQKHPFDFRISVQSLLIAVVGAIAAATVAWYGVIGRVSALEQRDREQEAHFTRIERAMQEQRDDVRQQLRDINGSVKDTNQKIDGLRDMLVQNSAGARPDIKRWSR
ncbi:hypothetical protein [Pandoraea sputorum]|uniref:hypothetical protein n=1 Tax=Pandoraea sputorum TaxID=93222 RepID=UPI001242FD7A|nr:hypothetical protein [Pandoraea sputorum]VVE77377.1 hypothetical protein PSP31120_01261 [Pandoraea sputorum]